MGWEGKREAMRQMQKVEDREQILQKSTAQGWIRGTVQGMFKES